MRRAVWILPLLGFGGAIMQMLATSESATSAPQQAVGGIYTMLWIVIPYCLARALSGLMQNDIAKRLDTQNEVLSVQKILLARIAFAAEAIAHRSDPAFRTEAEQEQDKPQDQQLENMSEREKWLRTGRL